MRKSRQDTEDTRRRIVESAAREFREQGIDGTGLASLMAAAGMTHGGFYKHFASKEQVVEESVALAIGSMVDAMERSLAVSPGERGLNAVIANYVSASHRDDVGDGCPLAALGGDLARASDGVRDAAEQGIRRMIDAIAAELDDRTPAAARKDAMVLLSTMVGALTLARIVKDEALSTTILAQARKHLASA
jgi:TetR/AcrR family transcriptional regulator, transcriptional repressor for nem operon